MTSPQRSLPSDHDDPKPRRGSTPIKAEAWDPAKHLTLLRAWAKQRGLTLPADLSGFFPPTGFLVDGCLVGFLQHTDAPRVAHLDCYIGDPKAGRERIGEAAVELTKLLLTQARLKGVRLVHAAAVVPTMAHATALAGFTLHAKADHMVCALEGAA